jgi:hypothetical protein
LTCALARHAGIVVAGCLEGHGRASSATAVDTGSVLTILARIIGLLLRAGIALILLVRRPRPIHARGAVYSGEIRWLPGRRATGIAWV